MPRAHQVSGNEARGGCTNCVTWPKGPTSFAERFADGIGADGIGAEALAQRHWRRGIGAEAAHTMTGPPCLIGVDLGGTGCQSPSVLMARIKRVISALAI